MTWADCSRCRYFISKDEMPEELVERAERWVALHRPGQQLIGWCRRFKRPVTYQYGKCHGYIPKQDNSRQMRLEQFGLRIKLR